jgi:ribonucleoside-diphosphate reductase beta chain
MSFNKFKNRFRGISNAVEATSKEEQIHGLFGIDLINIIKDEHPEWFDDTFKEEVVRLCREVFEAEQKVVEWIFEKGELDFITKDVVLEFIKARFNNSLESIGVTKIFDTDSVLLEQSEWFYDEVIAKNMAISLVKNRLITIRKGKVLQAKISFKKSLSLLGLLPISLYVLVK